MNTQSKYAIATLATGDYLQGAQVLFSSLKRYVPYHNSVDFICLTDQPGINAINKGIFPESLCVKPILISNKFNLDTSKEKPDFQGTINKFNFFRLIQAPFEYERIIYLDADMLVVRDLKDLIYSSETSKAPFEAVHDYAFIYNRRKSKNVKNVGLKPRHIFNSGLMVVNKKEALQYGLTFEALHNFFSLKNNRQTSYDGSDQGYLNYFIQKNSVPMRHLPVSFNYCYDNFYPSLPQDTVHIHHFTGHKPWRLRKLIGAESHLYDIRYTLWFQEAYFYQINKNQQCQ